MSIIYEALKKAERERQPPGRGVTLGRLASPPGRHRRWIAPLAAVVVMAVGSGITAWRWRTPEAIAPLMLKSELAVAVEGQGIESATAGDERRLKQEAGRPVPPLRYVEPVLSPMAPLELAAEMPSSAEAAFAEARRAQDGARWEEAVRRYQQAIALDPALLEARNNLGHLYVRLNRLSEAIAEFRTALVLAPDYAMARNNLGSAYLLNGQEDLAMPEFLEAVRLDGSYVTPYYNLALVYARRGHAGQAAAFLTKALAMDPEVLSWVREEPDFAAVWESPEFRRLRRVRTAQW